MYCSLGKSLTHETPYLEYFGFAHDTLTKACPNLLSQLILLCLLYRVKVLVIVAVGV